jgi:hypothetical protein
MIRNARSGGLCDGFELEVFGYSITAACRGDATPGREHGRFPDVPQSLGAPKPVNR